MSKKRTTYSAAFKAKVALAAQQQNKTISQLAAQFKVHPIRNGVLRYLIPVENCVFLLRPGS